MKLRLPAACLLFTLCVFPVLLFAQAAPRPVEFYFDEDRGTTRAYDVVPSEQLDERAINQLLRQPLRDRRAVENVGRIARTAMASGRTDLGRQLYERALADSGRDNSAFRPLLWNYGWDLLHAGEHEAALARWLELVNARNIRGQWMPPTLALGFWEAGRRDEALRWYAAAVRTEPDLWATPGDFSTLLPDWRAADRQVLAQVREAWAANPPAWP